MRDIIYLPPARADVARIFEHYAYDRGVLDVANRIVDGIEQTTEKLLTEFPNTGRNLDYYKVGLRALLVIHSHWVFYTVDDRTVYVHRIMAAKEIKSWDELDL